MPILTIYLFPLSILFFFSGEFNDLGIAEGKLDSELIGAVSSVRLVIKTSSKNWVIISEV